MTKREVGENYFHIGYNCSQAVVLAFKEELNLDETTLLKIASSFGGGMARMREVCGTVSGMLIVLGLLQGYTEPNNNQVKMAYYEKVRTLMETFKEKNGSYICKELLNYAKERGEKSENGHLHSCKLLVGDACEILENYLKK